MGYDSLIDLRDHFIGVLAREMGYRQSRAVAEWITSERTALWRAVNEQLIRRGRSLVSLSTIERIENTCTGADYASKLALRCAELVLYQVTEI